MQRIVKFILILSFGFSFANLAQAQSNGHSVKAGEPRSIEGINLSDRILVGTEDSGDIVVLEATATNPVRTPVHVHHIHHEAVYLISGVYRITIGDEVHNLTAGDFVFMPKGIQHRLEILEPGTAMVISSEGYDEARSGIFEMAAAGVSMREIYEELPYLEYISD